MSTGKLIKIYLINNNISQTSLAKKVNMTPDQLSASLNGKRKISIEEYSIIMEALNLDVNSFIGKKTLVNKYSLT